MVQRIILVLSNYWRKNDFVWEWVYRILEQGLHFLVDVSKTKEQFVLPRDDAFLTKSPCLSRPYCFRGYKMFMFKAEADNETLANI